MIVRVAICGLLLAEVLVGQGMTEAAAAPPARGERGAARFDREPPGRTPTDARGATDRPQRGEASSSRRAAHTTTGPKPSPTASTRPASPSSSDRFEGASGTHVARAPSITGSQAAEHDPLQKRLRRRADACTWPAPTNRFSKGLGTATRCER